MHSIGRLERFQPVGATGNDGVRWRSPRQENGMNRVSNARRIAPDSSASIRLKPAENLGFLHVIPLRDERQSATIR
jgi:hypothetical protein